MSEYSEKDILESEDCDSDGSLVKFSLVDEEKEESPTPSVRSQQWSTTENNRCINDKPYDKNNCPTQLYRKDLISAMKLPDAEVLHPDEYISIVDAWRQEWEKGVQVPVNPNAVHHPSAKFLKENSLLNGSYGFKMPKKLLRSSTDENYKIAIHELHETQKMADEVCRYDMDHLDYCWLQKFNHARNDWGEDEVMDYCMERVLEELETQCYSALKEVQAAGVEFDEDVVCDVCRLPDVEDGNEMVFCDVCDVGVHQVCYGIQKIPKGSWACRTCAVGLKPRCALCTIQGGAMKISTDGVQWAHLSCSIWIPEVVIVDHVKMEPVAKINDIPMTRWNLICVVCKERSGACIQCSVKKCKTAFHVTCAFSRNYQMVLNLDDASKDLQSYCGVHSKDRDAEVTADACLDEEDTIVENSRRMQKIAEEFYKHINVSEVASKLHMKHDVVSCIFEYWKLKRKCHFNKPLLTPKVEEGDLLLRQRQDVLKARLRMFIHLRQDLERVRNLCYMVNKRERMRASFYQLKRELFNQQVAALNSYNGYESKDLEAIKSLHHYNDSLYDRPIDVINTAKFYEAKWAEDDDAQVIDVGNVKDVLDFNSTFNSDVFSTSSTTTLTASASNSIHEFLFSKKVNQKHKNNVIKSKPSKSMINLPLQDSKNKSVPKVKKRKSKWECYGNPYAKPTYKSFAWMLGGRKKRKLSESANDASEMNNNDINDENQNSIARDDGIGSTGVNDVDVSVSNGATAGVNIKLEEIDQLKDEIKFSVNKINKDILQTEPPSTISSSIQKSFNKNTRYMRYKNLKVNEVLQDVKNTDEKSSNEMSEEIMACQKVSNDLEKAFGKLSRIVKLGKKNNSRVNCMNISQTENDHSKSPIKRDSNEEDDKDMKDTKFYNGLKRPGLFDSTHVFTNNNISDHTANNKEVNNSNDEDFEKDDLKEWSEWNRSILNGMKAAKAASKKEKESKRRKNHLSNGFNQNDCVDNDEIKNKFNSNKQQKNKKYDKVDPGMNKTWQNHANNLNSTIKDKNPKKKFKNKKNNKVWSSEKQITIKKSDGEDDNTIDILEVDNDNSRSSGVDFEDKMSCNSYESPVKVSPNNSKSNNNVSNTVKNLEKNKFIKGLSKNKKSLDNIRSIQVTLDTFIKNNKISTFLDDGSKRELNNAVSDKISPSKNLSPLKRPECLLAIKPNKAQRNNNFNDKIKSPFDHKINNDNISPVFSKNHLNDISKKNKKVNENNKILKNKKLITKNKLLIKKKISYLLENSNSNIHKYLKSKTLSDKLKVVP